MILETTAAGGPFWRRHRHFRFRLLSLVFLLFLSVMGNAALIAHASQPTANVSISPTTYLAKVVGENCDLYVNIYDVSNLWSLRLTITYNASVLDLLKIVQGSFFPASPASSFQYQSISSSGTLKINMSLAGSQLPLNGNGELVWLRFQVIKKPSSSVASVLVFSQASLFDHSAKSIPCDSDGAVCFFGSLGPDPSGQGLLVLRLNKNLFLQGETVSISSAVTFSGDPVPNKLVAFQIIDPSNNTVTLGEASTGSNGIAAITFAIPITNSSLGQWTVISTVEIDQVVYWDIANFRVISTPVGGYSFALTVESKSTNAWMPYSALFILLSLALIVYKPRRSTK